jgi:hypothetical protein
MRKAVIAAGWLLALAGAAWAQQGTNGPQPGKQQGSGLFNRNEPAPMYSTSYNNETASLQAPGTASPNAGNTGATGSGSTSHGWAPPAYSSSPGQQR